MITVRFLTSGRQARAEAGISLLRLSIHEKAGIPFKCAGGVCGTCRCRVEQGGGNLAAVTSRERRHLSEAEIAEGWRMACQAFVTGDVVVSWPAA
uniref:2Fe-2S iron-sulfur cluster-binding protein n=1 Tax=Belnapia arida TaxID=2804533 RepID=UPI0038CFA5CC